MMGTKDNPGLVILAIRQIFSTIERDTSSVYLVRVSFMEIYNEETNDLLNANSKTSKNLAIREVGGQFKVTSLTEQIVTSADEIFACLERGNNNRKVGVSNLNEHSSRSHSIFRITLESALKIDSNTTLVNGGSTNSTKSRGGVGAVKVSELNLCDLAGSETLAYEFGASQQKETKSINLSLTQLKSVITSLSKGDPFVPFRNSSLTKLLRTSLGGNAKTTLVCAMNPLPVHVKVSRSTLQFGQMASAITNKAKVNEMIDDQNSLIREQQSKIHVLEEKLSALSALESEKERIQNDYLQLQRHLQDLQRKEAEHQDLQRQMAEMNKMVVHGGATTHSTDVNYLTPITVSTVSEEELAALSRELSSLQKDKSKLEQSKLDLESQLHRQLALHHATEAEIARKQDELESMLAKSDRDQAELNDMIRQLKQREVEDQQLHQQLQQQSTTLEEKRLESEKLHHQLMEQSRTLEEKSHESEQLQSDLMDAQYALQAKEDEMAEKTEQLLKAHRTMAEKEAEIHRKNDELARLLDEQQKQSDRLHSQLAHQTAELRRMESEQRAASESYEAQVRQLDDARRQQEKMEAQMRELQEAQRRKEEELRRQARQMEADAQQRNRQLQANIDSLALERERLVGLNHAAKERWDREMKLQSESGLDKDSYLAQLIDRYEQQQHDLRHQLSESESMRLVTELRLTDEIGKLKRQLAAAQASLTKESEAVAQAEAQAQAKAKANGGGAPSISAGPASSPSSSSSSANSKSSNATVFPQPTSPISSSSSSSELPYLVIPGVIELADSEKLLTEPTSRLAMCAGCGSKDRIRSEMLRQLCNHARKTLATQFKQVTQLESTVQLYEMQLKEYEQARRR